MLAPLGQALDALQAEFSGLLTAPDPALPPQVTVLAAKPGLAGIGGYVGLNAAPVAELHARRLEAEVAVRVFADTAAGLFGAEAQAARDIIAADPGLLRRRGILTVARVTDRDMPTLQASDGIAAPFGRDLRFSVRFEHRPLPTATEGVLGALPLDATLAELSGTGRLVYEHDFATDPLGDFTAIDSPTGAGTAGAWGYDAAAGEVTQTGTRASGSNGIRGNKGGTYLVLNPVAGGDVFNFVLNAEMQSGPQGGIGFVFRFRDTANFGFALLELPAAVRVMGKRVGNTGTLFDEGGQDPTQGYAPDTPMRLRFLADGDRFELAIDEAIALSGRDAALTQPGTVGFFCRRADQARFRHFRLSSL